MGRSEHTRLPGAIGSVAMLAVAAMLSAQAGEAWARVQGIRGGTAQYSRDGKTWQRLFCGMTLQAGQTVRTDRTAVIDLFLPHNGPVLRATPGTTVKLAALSYEVREDALLARTELELLQGRMLGRATKRAEGSTYTVKTLHSTHSILNGGFDIATDSGDLNLTKAPRLATLAGPRLALTSPAR